MAKIEKQEKEKAGFLQWLFIIIIPLVFAVTLTGIILTVAGVNVLDHAKNVANHIPGISSVIETEEEVKQATAKKRVEDNKEQVEAAVANKDEEIETLKSNLTEKEREIDELTQELAKLSSQLEEQNNTNEEVQQNILEDVSASFEGMDPEEAAPIISNLEVATAIRVLKNVPSEERGLILGAMEPEQAATFTTALLADE
ncbi:hypothetical protein KO561_08875 [Radiobacillus kanasensis]|uniref:MotE family protein n=1 Tax=Radiobacillus kanasensis TaxID=2844358 RepID=UPI001E49A30B|nr:hypothetical protein [Radiobacillus kanasensis]UFU01026.1 hypothetical protein KO561_08875 [Radiobacillus kanasensis]